MKTIRRKDNEKWNDTDYDIPKFSYKSAFLILPVTFLVTVLAIYLTDSNRLAIIFSLSISLSLTTAYSRYFIDTKRGLTKGFYKTVLLIFVACVAALWFVRF